MTTPRKQAIKVNRLSGTAMPLTEYVGERTTVTIGPSLIDFLEELDEL